MSCTTNTAKCILILINLIVMLGSLLLIIIGGIALSKETKGFTSLAEVSVGAWAVAIGIFVLIVTLIGFCGVISNSAPKLTTYAAILLVIFFLQMALVILAFMQLRNGNGQLSDKVRNSLNTQFESGSSDKIDAIQFGFQCCGIDNAEYWTKERNVPLPSSCCEKNICDHGPMPDGCLSAIVGVISRNLLTIGIIAILFAVIEVVAIALACCLRSGIQAPLKTHSEPIQKVNKHPQQIYYQDPQDQYYQTRHYQRRESR